MEENVIANLNNETRQICFTLSLSDISIRLFALGMLNCLFIPSTLIHHYHSLSHSAYKTIYPREIHSTRIKNIRLIPPEFQANPPRGNLWNLSLSKFYQFPSRLFAILFNREEALPRAMRSFHSCELSFSPLKPGCFILWFVFQAQPSVFSGEEFLR